MKRKPQTPYQRLYGVLMEFARSVFSPKMIRMWRYDRISIEGDATWKLSNLTERVAAADQLGYDVIIRNEDGNLVVYYRERPAKLPGWIY